MSPSRLGIAEHLDRPFGHLSTGQRQKLAIVRGLMQRARRSCSWTSRPGRSTRSRRSTIREFVAEHIVGELGSTVVLATHSMPEAEDLCRRLAFIQDGRIMAEGHRRGPPSGDRLRHPLRAPSRPDDRHRRGRPGRPAGVLAVLPASGRPGLNAEGDVSGRPAGRPPDAGRGRRPGRRAAAHSCSPAPTSWAARPATCRSRRSTSTR